MLPTGLILYGIEWIFTNENFTNENSPFSCNAEQMFMFDSIENEQYFKLHLIH